MRKSAEQGNDRAQGVRRRLDQDRAFLLLRADYGKWTDRDLRDIVQPWCPALHQHMKQLRGRLLELDDREAAFLLRHRFGEDSGAFHLDCRLRRQRELPFADLPS